MFVITYGFHQDFVRSVKFSDHRARADVMFPQRPHNSFFDFIIDVTNPVMDLAKKITPPLGMIDISPIIARLPWIF